MSDSTMLRKTKFYWASIAGADPEPVELIEIDGRKAIYTCGCGDPFFLDDADTKIRLGEERASIHGDQQRWIIVFRTNPRPMERPTIPASHEAQAQLDAIRRERAETLPRHGWRGAR